MPLGAAMVVDGGLLRDTVLQVLKQQCVYSGLFSKSTGTRGISASAAPGDDAAATATYHAEGERRNVTPGILTLIVLILLMVVAPNGPGHHHAPIRIRQQSIISYGLVRPTTMAFAPDGRLFIAEQDGRLRIYNGELLTTPALTLPVTATASGGCWKSPSTPILRPPVVYLYYTAGAAPVHNRVSRFTMQENTVVDRSERLLIRIEPLGARNDSGGAIHFGTDNRSILRSERMQSATMRKHSTR